MKAFFFVILAIVSIALLATAIWLWPFLRLFIQDHHVWHQKLTVVVATPSGDRTGASVVEVRAAFGQQPLSGNEVNYDYTGEATLVEVAPGRYLFALLGGSEERFYWAARERFGDKARGEWLYDIPRQTEPVTLDGPSIPLLVTFDDPADPKTVRRVDPDDLDAAFGCAHDLMPEQAPWRAEGRTWRSWAGEEAQRHGFAAAAAAAGITGPAATALVDYGWLTRPGVQWTAEDLERRTQLRTLFTADELERWTQAYAARHPGPDPLPPTPTERAAATGGPCHRLAEVTLAITDEPVTKGKVEAVLGWVLEAGKSRFNIARTAEGKIPLDALLSDDHWGK